MKTFDELVSQLRTAEGAGFDVSAGQVGEVLNRWIKRLAVLSLWVREERELGPTVDGQDTYPIPDDIIEIHELYVGANDTFRCTARDLFRLKGGSSSIIGGPPWVAFTEREDASGTKQLAIYPGPSSSGDVSPGLALLAFCAVTPTDMAGAQTPPFPDDLEDTLLNGARATLHRDIDNDPDLGDYYEQKFNTEAERLRRRANSRVGSGAFQIPVARY